MVEFIKKYLAGSTHVQHSRKSSSRRPVRKFLDSVAEGYGINLADGINNGNF